MTIIDAHSHIVGDDEEMLSLLATLDVHCFNICVAHVGLSHDVQRCNYADIARKHPERYQWITTFEVPDFDDPDYVDRVRAQLDQDFANGAIGCKVWKNIGMEIRTPDGDYMQVDHPLLTPIFEHIAYCDRPLLAHVGEPYACWQPLDFDSPHAGYYATHPQWHMYRRPDAPSYQHISDAFDRLLERHRNLRIIGAHLGSQEYDLSLIARRMDRNPHYAVDTGARNYDLAFTDRNTVIHFMEQYSERVLFGIDLGMPASGDQDSRQRQALMRRYEQELDEALRYYGSAETVVMRERQIDGLDLDTAIQERLFRDNARQWYQVELPEPNRASG